MSDFTIQLLDSVAKDKVHIFSCDRISPTNKPPPTVIWLQQPFVCLSLMKDSTYFTLFKWCFVNCYAFACDCACEPDHSHNARAHVSTLTNLERILNHTYVTLAYLLQSHVLRFILIAWFNTTIRYHTERKSHHTHAAKGARRPGIWIQIFFSRRRCYGTFLTVMCAIIKYVLVCFFHYVFIYFWIEIIFWIALRLFCHIFNYI